MEPDGDLNNRQNETEGTMVTSSTDETIVSSNEVPQPIKTSMGNGSDDPVQDKPKKKSHVMAIGMVFLAILAIGGIGFGVWAWTSGEAQNKRYEEDMANLRSQLAEATQIAEEKVNDVEVDVNIDTNDYKNPVIKSSDSAEIYRMVYDFLGVGDGANIVRIDVKDGKIEKCELGKRVYTETGGNSTTPVADCNIVGLNGEIFKVVRFGAGQDGSLNRIGFIMVDGTVKYTLPLYEAISANDLGIKGDLKMGGFVTDAVEVGVADAVRGYGYGATVFVMRDGSYVKYDESMSK